jgi:hypothetical protein
MPEVGTRDLRWEDLKPGTVIATQTYLMTLDDIRSEAEACEDYDPIYGDVDFASKSDIGHVVTPFYLSIGEFVLPLLKNGMKMGVNTIYASSIKESYLPICIGDVITKTLSVDETYEKRGKKFLVWRIEYRNQDGALAQLHLRTSYWVGTPQPLIGLDKQGGVA